MNVGAALVIVYGLYGAALAVQSALSDNKPHSPSEAHKAGSAQAAAKKRGKVVRRATRTHPNTEGVDMTPKEPAPGPSPYTTVLDISGLASNVNLLGIGILGGTPNPTKSDPGTSRRRSHR